MNNGISGYNSGRINSYRQLEKAADAGREAAAQRPDDAQRGSAAKPSLGVDLSSEESRMIHQNFPPSPQLTMRLYGPGRQAQNLNPSAVGSRLDLRG